MSQNQKDPSIVALKDVRLSYAFLFKPRASEDNPDDPKYSCSLLLDKKKDAAQIAKLNKAIEACIVEKWKDKRPGKGSLKLCLRDGSEKDDKEGYSEDIMFISTSSVRQPKVLEVRDGVFYELKAESGKPYSGCFVHASVRVWAQDNKFGKRINAEIRAVVFSKDGEPFGGGTPVNAEEEFGGIVDIEEKSADSEDDDLGI